MSLKEINIADGTLKTIGSLTTLKVLDQIAKLPNLTAADVRGTNIDPTALQTIAERRPKLRIVK